MAFAGASFRPIDPRRGSAHRSRASRGLITTAIAAGFGIVATCWIIATLATMQKVATALDTRDTARFETALAINPIVRAPSAERRFNGSKFSRLPLPMDERVAQSGLTSDAIKSSRMRMAMMARLTKDTAGHGGRNGLTADAIRTSLTRTTAVASLGKLRTGGDRIVAVASATLSVADKGFAANATAVVQPTLATALVEASATRTETLPKPFSLVLADPEASFADDLPESIPLPVSRPEGLAKIAIARPAEDEKRTGKTELAYADPKAAMDDDSDDGIMPTTPRRKGRTAYYDISAGVVHMPNGEKLEAHSGIGEMRDNPKFTHVKMRGPTPAGTYKITLREKLFHGVEAVRLTPTNGIAPLGRTGLLAHSYLLRKRGDSHGCVAFADYQRFLKAFKRGEVDTMVIVHKMSGWRSFTASADDGKPTSRQKVVR